MILQKKMKKTEVISGLTEIRNKMLHAIESNNAILAKFTVNDLDNFIYKIYLSEDVTTQESGLTDFELEMDKLADKILDQKTSLHRIGVLRDYFLPDVYYKNKLTECLNWIKSDLAQEQHVKLTKTNSEYKIKFLNKLKKILEC